MPTRAPSDRRFGRFRPISGAVEPQDPSLIEVRADVDGRVYALELLEPSPADRTRFLAELKVEAPAALAFRHPDALRVREIDARRLEADGGGPVLVATDAPSGISLRRVLDHDDARRRSLPIQWVLHVALSLARVLWSIERAPGPPGLPGGHGGLAPTRIWIDAAGRARVGSVGLPRARLCLTPSPDVVALRAPELLASSDGLAPAADVYSLGMLMFDLLVGRSVQLQADVEATRRAALEGERPRLVEVRPDVEPHLEALIEWMLARRATERPSSVGTVVPMLDTALRRLAEGSSSSRAVGAWISARFPTNSSWTDHRDLLEDGGVLERVPNPLTSDLVAEPPTETARPAPPKTITRATADEEGADELRWSVDERVEFEARFVRLGPASSAGWAPARDRVRQSRAMIETLPPHEPTRLELRLDAWAGLPAHPQILHMLGIWPTADDRAVVVSEVFDGQPLSERVARVGPLGPSTARRWCGQLLAGLSHLHRWGLVHGALHPDALLVRGDGTETELRVGGLMQAVAGIELADPKFISPEQARGAPPTSAADIWSAGAVTYFALTGRAPHVVSSRASLVEQIEKARTPSWAGLGAAVADFEPMLRLALEPEPSRRAASVDALRRALEDPTSSG